MAKIIRKIIVLTSLFLTVSVISCSKKGTSKQDEEKIQEIVAKMCVKHNADSTWITPIRELADEYFIYSIYLKDLLIREDSLPILLKGNAIDIVEKTDGYYVHFLVEINYLFSHIVFVIKCTEEQAFKVAYNPSNVLYFGDEDFAVVAVINDVKKTTYQVMNYDEEYYDEDVSYTVSTLTIDFATNNFIAMGECVEVLSMKEIADSLHTSKIANGVKSLHATCDLYFLLMLITM